MAEFCWESYNICRIYDNIKSVSFLPPCKRILVLEMKDQVFVYLIIITIIIRIYIAINELQKGVKPIQSINTIKYLANQ